MEPTIKHLPHSKGADRPLKLELGGASNHESGPILGRIRERRVSRWILAYLAAAWMLLQLMDVLSGVWGWSVAAQRAISLGAGLGLLPTAVVAWFHGEKGRQDVCVQELVLVGATIAVSARLMWAVLSG